MKLLRTSIAEGFGAFTLTLLVSISLTHVLPIPTPILAGLTLCLFVYTIGPISGSNINPAVTLALLSARKLPIASAVAYIVAQCIGAGVALWLTGSIVTLGTPVVTADNTWMVALAEAAGAFVFLFGIGSVVAGKVSDAASGIVIGGSLLLGILVASIGSNGVLNPAVAFGIGSLSTMYVLGPIVGGIAGLSAYRWIVR